MIKLAQIINAAPSLQKVSWFDLNIQLSYRVKEIADILQEHCDYYNKESNELFLNFAQEDKDGQSKIPEENQKALQESLDSLLDTEIDIEFDRIKIPLNENLRLSVNDVRFLTPFVEFVETSL